jgi:alanine racemase
MATLFQFPYRTFEEVNLKHLIKNLYTLRTVSKKEVIPILKADAYGHGVVPVAKALIERGGCEMIAVATLEEGIDLRKKISYSTEILILSGYAPHQIEAYLKYKLVPMIYSLYHLKSLSNRKFLPPFHLEIDTGMHRLGILESEISEAIKIIKKFPEKISGIATHLAESENTVSDFTDVQAKKFSAIVDIFRAEGVLNTDARIHISNSGGILRKIGNYANAIRPGLALFGVSPNPMLEVDPKLVPVLQWKTRIFTIKKISKGETIGYNRTYKTKKSEKIAIVGIGYADGYPRSISNKGSMLVNGKAVPIRGIVSMDLTALDVSHASDAKEGLLVTILGTEGEKEISATDIANWAETIPYEIFCGISQRVPRLYIE